MSDNDDFHKRTTQPGFSVEEKKNHVVEEIPESIGPYKVESLLEKGGMSLVYLGTHPESKDPVIIKILMPKFLSHPEIVERFLREAEIISMTDHPNIVKLYGHGTWEGGLYIAMEFVQGLSLRQFIQYAPMSLKRALDVVLEIAYALCHLHTHGVIHRDLKPENILMTDSGIIKVIDFGIAQLLTEQPGKATQQRFMGTPFYMSPEQKENPENVTYSSDVYSLGIIAYEIIIGKPSHGSIHLSLLPKGLQKILSKCLQPLPEDRYLDIVDFISDLSEYLNSELPGKETKSDQLTEISENLQEMQTRLLTRDLPQWLGVEIGAVYSRGIKLLGTYADFLTLPEGKFGFFFAESTSKGALGVVYSAGLRGMIRSIFSAANDLKSRVKQLNQLIAQDPITETFQFGCLILSPKDNSFEYLSCEAGTLWIVPMGEISPKKIVSANKFLGEIPIADFSVTTHTWNPGDHLFHSYGEEEAVKPVIVDHVRQPAQKQAEAILRKIKTVKADGERSTVVVSIHRR